ncbi:MAG: ATP-binding protein [Elusimicrobia bacterium]|nr:ATP-binding protein [Elusimicrobiota bacterium]
MIARRIEPLVLQDLEKKMVLISGPRQCGKTFLAKHIVGRLGGRLYNWDSDADRQILRRGTMDAAARLWALDEVHKNRRWRNWLKGLYDADGSKHSILVTGSARLELYGRGGDSMQGRYFAHRLHPFTLSEIERVLFPADHVWLKELSPVGSGAQACLRDLLNLGGFPEPFLSGSARHAGRWRLAYGSLLVREEVRDLEAVQDLERMELLFERLEKTVGSPLSLNALRDDLEVAHGTLRNWVSIFERLYGIFRVPPFGPPRIQAVKKEAKAYYWDWGRVPDAGARFENMIAVHLLRLVHWLQDCEGRKAELRYFRTRAGHEVDFVVLLDGRPWCAVEAKLGERPVEGSLQYFVHRVPVHAAFQVSMEGTKDYLAPPVGGVRVRVLPAATFLMNLP